MAPPHSAGPPLAVLFDMDGTLLDTERLWWEAAADILGKPPDPARYAGATAEGYLELLAADLGRPVHHAHFDAALADRHARTGIRLMPGVQSVLDRLTAAGIPLALVTSSDKAAVNTALPLLGPDRFQAIVSADDVQHHKPHPQPYLLAAQRLGVQPPHCVAVEDSHRGVTAAQAAGCRVVAVPNLAPIPPAPDIVVLSSLLDWTEAIGWPTR